MTYRNYSHSLESDSLAGGAAAIAIVVLVILAFVLVKTLIYMVTTFVTYHGHKALWIALSIWGGCCLLAVLCAGLRIASPFPELAGASFLGLLVTCFIVDLRNRETLLRENVNLIEEVLHTSWWA